VVAGLPTATQSEPCPEAGNPIALSGGQVRPWGDVNCDGRLGADDALLVLRYEAGRRQERLPGCPLVGSATRVVG
jgi:hypothetical protein